MKTDKNKLNEERNNEVLFSEVALLYYYNHSGINLNKTIIQ